MLHFDRQNTRQLLQCLPPAVAELECFAKKFERNIDFARILYNTSSHHEISPMHCPRIFLSQSCFC
jgi:hypothetical protein